MKPRKRNVRNRTWELPVKRLMSKSQTKKCKWLANQIKYSTSFFFKSKKCKTKQKRACILGSVDHNLVSCLRGWHPSPIPWQRYTTGPTPQESNLVISLKSPTALFSAIYPKAKTGSNLYLQHVLNQLQYMHLMAQMHENIFNKCQQWSNTYSVRLSGRAALQSWTYIMLHTHEYRHLEENIPKRWWRTAMGGLRSVVFSFRTSAFFQIAHYRLHIIF